MKQDNLSKEFHEQGTSNELLAVDHVDFTIQNGSFCALVGESGSGKSTLAQLMCGLLVPSSGEVLFEGKNISLCRGKQKQVLRSKIQLILQDGKGAMDPRFTVYQIIAEPIRNFRKLSKKEEEREINDLLTMMELPEEIKLRKAHELSGGQQKRVCIARALAAQPDVLIFDEAVSGLDVLVRKHILDLLKRLHQERKMTCFFITHDLDVALYLADRVMVMRCGKIIEDRTFHGSTDCFTHPSALDNLTMALPLGIVNPAAFEGGVEKAYENCVSATMGTGPYMFDRVEGDTYTFIRNPYYWGEAPEVDEFKVKVIPDNAAKILALRNGEIDAILGSSRLSAEGYTEISQDAAFGHAMDDSTNQTRYLGMNLNKAPFNDPLVREAVSYAVNQQELETSVFDGLETAAETLFPNEKPNCGVEVKTYPTDMEKAKQLMKEAGYEDTNDDGILEKDGTSLAIHFNYSQSLASVDNAVLSIAASLKELGFDVTIDAVDMNTWYGALMAGEYDLTFYNTAGGSFDPATDMSNMAPGAMGDPILCQFSAFFENPEIFAELDSTSDSQRVQEIYGMILNGIADQNLLVPVTGTHDLALWNTDKITGYDFYTDASYVDIASVHVK